MLAMAGLAEGAIAIQIAITWFGVFLIGALALVAFSSGNKWIHFIVLMLAIAFGISFVPWEMPFSTLTVEDRKDPDVVLWFGRFQTLAYACYILMCLVLANFLQYIKYRKPWLKGGAEIKPGTQQIAR